MGRITIFTKNDCHYCIRAKRELEYRCLPFVEIPIEAFPGKNNNNTTSSSGDGESATTPIQPRCPVRIASGEFRLSTTSSEEKDSSNSKENSAPAASTAKNTATAAIGASEANIELILDPNPPPIRCFAPENADRKDDMLSLCGRLTVPQIFFNETPVGGCDDLMDLLDQWDVEGEGIDDSELKEEEEDNNNDQDNEHKSSGGSEDGISGSILKNSRIWRRYQKEVASQPDPTDPRLALPPPIPVPEEGQPSASGAGAGARASGGTTTTSPKPSSGKAMMRRTRSKHGSSASLTDLLLEGESVEEEDFGCINLPDGTCASVREVMTDLVENMPRQKLAYLAKYYNDCFQGDKGVDALLKIYPFERPSDNGDQAKGRARAVEFGRLLQRYGILHHVCNEHDFEDTDWYYYRLQPFHQPHVLNSFQSLHRVIENMPRDKELGSSFQKQCEDEKTEHSSHHSIGSAGTTEVVLTPDGALQLLTKLQRLLSNIENKNTGRDGIDFLACKDYDDPDYLALEEDSCQLQMMDANALAVTMTEEQKLVFGIHLYNVMVRHAYIKVGVPLQANQRGSFFTGVCYNIANQILSLDDVEHGMIRANTRHPYHLHKQFASHDDPRRAWAVANLDPRIHFTLFCGANSCPPINSYTVENIESELQLAAEAFCQEDSNVMLEEKTNTIRLSMLFYWYRNDFGASNETEMAAKILQFLPKRGAKYRQLARMFSKKSGSFSGLFRSNGKEVKIKYFPYDWGSKSAPGKCLEFKSSVLKTKWFSTGAIKKTAPSGFTGTGCVAATSNAS